MPMNTTTTRSAQNERSGKPGSMSAWLRACASAFAAGILIMSTPAAQAASASPVPETMYSVPVADLSIKVWGGTIDIRRGYYLLNWYANINWMPLSRFTYDYVDNSIKSVTRGRTEYSKVAPGVFQDQYHNTIRQTDTGFRWNDPQGNWIEYNNKTGTSVFDTTATIQAFGNRNGTVATFQYNGANISGILDHSGTQVLWFDYNANQLSRVHDTTGRKVEYTQSGLPLSGTPGSPLSTLGVLDPNGNTWTYKIVGMGQSITATDPEAHATVTNYFVNGELLRTTYPDGSEQSTDAMNYDSAKNTFYTRETAPGGKVTETWFGLKQDLGRNELQRRDINGVTVEKQSLDTASRTTTVTNARGLNTAITRDQWDNITKIVYPDASRVTTEYDPTYSNVTKNVDENGVITQNTYDAHGNLTKTVEAVGLPEQRTTEYTYDADSQRTSMTRKGDANTNTPDAITRYSDYDNNGNVRTVTDPEGGITRYTYDVMGNALTKIDPNGKLWKRTYDNKGHLTSVTDPLNRTTTIGYDKAGLPITLTDAANNTSTLGYDPAGRLLSITDPYGAKTSYTYDAAGNLVTLTDAEKHIQKQDYDLDGRLTKQTDGNNNVTQFVYGDQASGFNRLLIKIIYPTLTQDLQYDQRDRITKSTDTTAGSAIALDAASSQTTQNQYDAAGNPTVVTDPANRSGSTKYNAYGEVIQTTDPANGTTSYGYDPRGNLITVKDAKGNTHRFEYDKLDRMVKEIRPLGQTIVYAYDAVGNLKQVTDPKGQIKIYTYDDANRRTQENHYLNAAAVTAQNAVKSISYSYNTLDRLTGYDDGTTKATYTYDPKQLRQIGESTNYGTFTLATSTGYNAIGQKNSLTYPDGANYTYTYDTNNQLSTVNFPTGYGSITINSYLWTVPSQITLPGGTVRTQNYDGLLRVKDFSVKDPGQSQVLNYQYGYDLTNNITSKATEAGTTNYGYDTLDHLTSATYTGQATPQINETYSYDPVANRITDSKTAAATWTYNENNQLKTADNLTYTYDDNGNTTQQADANNPANTRNYVYDTDNRLIEVRNASNTLIAAYSYDPFGRRISKDAGNGKTYYFYSAEGLIAEADASGQVIKSYGYAPGRTFSTNPLWMKATATGAQTQSYYYYQNDHLGTPQKLLNQSGVTVWSATYDAFGKATVDPASTVMNNLRLPGQYADAETGLHYNWMRYYDPGTGRYRTSDPIGLRGGINDYTYANANPLYYFDSTGLVPNDQWYGRNDSNFRDWAHQQKQDMGKAGNENFTKEEIEDLWKQWNDEACPRGKGGKSGKGGRQRGFIDPSLIRFLVRFPLLVCPLCSIMAPTPPISVPSA